MHLQAGIGTGKVKVDQFKEKVEAIAKALKVPLQVMKSFLEVVQKEVFYMYFTFNLLSASGLLFLFSIRYIIVKSKGSSINDVRPQEEVVDKLCDVIYGYNINIHTHTLHHCVLINIFRLGTLPQGL